MKTAVCGVWHVHAGDYTKRAQALDEVVGFWEEDDVLAEQFQSVFPIRRFGSLEELLESDAEGVIVCTATNEHIHVMPRIAAAGKHIFTEKVLALTSSDCEAIEKAVEEAGVRFMISLPHKTMAPHNAVKAVVDSGELGKINYLRFRNCHSGSTRGWLPVHFYNAEQCGGGAMIDLGAHGMYLTHWILGMPLAAKSAFTVAHDTPKNIDLVEDNAVTVMTFENGAIAINETGFVSEYAPLVLEVSGERGFVKMEGRTVTKCTMETEGKTVEVPQGENLPLPIDQFVTGKPLPGYGMAEAKALTKLMELAYAGK